MPTKNKTAPVATKKAPKKVTTTTTTKKGAPKVAAKKDSVAAIQEPTITVVPKGTKKGPAPKGPTAKGPTAKKEVLKPIDTTKFEISAGGKTSVIDALSEAVSVKVQDASYLDKMAAIEKRRANALRHGKAYLMGCVHCGSPDVNANRSIYVADFEGKTVNIKDYRCADCHYYTRTIAETGQALQPTDKLTVLYDAPTRKNYHRAKAHSVDKAFEFVGVAKPTEGDDYTHLNDLIELAKSGNAEAARVLKEGVAIKVVIPPPAEK